MKVPRALVDIVIAIGLFVFAGVLVAWSSAHTPNEFRLPLAVALQGLLVVGVVAAMLGWRRGSWQDIWIVPPRVVDVLRGPAAFAACLGINFVFIYGIYYLAPEQMERHSDQLGFVAQQLAHGLPWPLLVGLLGFVGVYEELFARGLLLARCRELFGGVWIPIFLSSALFGLGHLYQGWIGVVQTTLIGLVLARATIRWKTLWPAIIAHALIDISAVLAMTGLGDGDVGWSS